MAGGAGPGWVEKHVAEYVCIAGSMLGSPKVLTGLLSGEMRDTAEMQGLQEYLTNAMVPYPLRIDLWRSWGSLLSILPMGGEAIWGNLTYTPDILDTEGAALPLIMERRVSSEEKQARSEKFPNQTLLRIGNKTVEDALELLWEMGGKEFAAKGAQNSYGADYEVRPFSVLVPRALMLNTRVNAKQGFRMGACWTCDLIFGMTPTRTKLCFCLEWNQLS